MTDRLGSVFGHYAIGVFDLLGQSEKLLSPLTLPAQTDAETQQVLDNLKDTAGAVLRFRNTFREQFDALAQDRTAEQWVSQLPTAQQNEVRASMASKILSWGMSDTYVVAVPLHRPSTFAAMADIYRALVVAAGTWLTALASGTPIRGGFEIGTAIEIGTNEVYGQALVMAHRLESQVAGGPRIVIGETLVDNVRDVQSNELHADIDLQRAAHLAAQFAPLLVRDTDGAIVLDTLGAIGNLEAKAQWRSIFARAHESVHDQLRRHEVGHNNELVSRYKRLRDYFKDQVPKWQEE